VAAAAATVPGRVLQGVFGIMGVLRPAPKPLHPSGTLRRSTIRRHGLTDGERVGVPWIDEAGTSDAVGRFSRATGLPDALPDIHGLAIRVLDDPADPADILLATTGLGCLTRFVLRPSRSAASGAYSTLLPYSTSSGPVLLAAVPDRREAGRLFLAVASPLGHWTVFADLRVADPDPAATGDAISFDPILNQLEGLGYYPWATQLREGAYRAARWSRSRR
jgi:hypothetical protein